MLSSAGCFALFGELLARHQVNPAYATVGGLFHDAYALQHPGEDNPQAISHVAVHSISLYGQLEKGLYGNEIYRIRQLATQQKFKSQYIWLKPPGPIWTITIADVYPLTDVDAHNEQVRAWAQHTWDGWSMHHPRLLEWYAMVTA